MDRQYQISVVILHHTITPDAPTPVLQNLIRVAYSIIDVVPFASGRSGAVSGEVCYCPIRHFGCSCLMLTMKDNITSWSFECLRNLPTEGQFNHQGIDSAIPIDRIWSSLLLQRLRSRDNMRIHCVQALGSYFISRLYT